MNMSVAEARELLRVPPMATRDELQQAKHDKLIEAVLQNDAHLLDRVIYAFATVMMDEGMYTVHDFDQYLAGVRDLVTRAQVEMDQYYAARA